MDININPAKETFFFEQTGWRRKQGKRNKKQPEDLPHDLRFAHLNPRVAAYLANKEKEDKRDARIDALGNKSLLPQINQTVSLIQHRLDNLLSGEDDPQRILFDESKLGADNLLDELARILYLFERRKPTLPEALESSLSIDWKDLTSDIHVVPRLWQMASSAVTNVDSEEDPSPNRRQAGAAAGGAPQREGEDLELKLGRSKMSSRMSSASGLLPDGATEARPGSVIKATENAPPSIVVPRRESRASCSSINQRPKTRLEKFKGGMHLEPSSAGRPTSAMSSSSRGTSTYLSESFRSFPGGKRFSMHRGDGGASVIEEVPSEYGKSAGPNQSFYQVINFQLSSKVCEDKGWIVHPDAKDDRERETVLEWATQRLQAAIKAKNENLALEKKMGMDHPTLLRYYGDGQKEHGTKYKSQSARSKPSAGVHQGEKPNIPSLRSRRDGALFRTTTGDGSSTVFYPSGRPAIVASRSVHAAPSFYTFVFADSPERSMLACFTPAGRGSCYHDNGTIRFLATVLGGTMADLDGGINKRWKWPLGSGKLPVTILFQLNTEVTFRCVNQSQMQIFFSAQKEHAKFTVGATSGLESSEETGSLITGLTFVSQAAKDCAKPSKLKVQPARSKTRSSKHKIKSHVSTSFEVQKVLDLGEPVLNDEEADRGLYKIQRKIKNLVEDWLEHYRIAVGIASPHLKTVRDPRARDRATSAKSNPGGGAGPVIIERAATQIPRASPSTRIPSAPPGRTVVRIYSGLGSRAPPDIAVGVPVPLAVESVTEDMTTHVEVTSPTHTMPYTASFQHSGSPRPSYRVKSAPSRPVSVSVPRDLASSSLRLCPAGLRECLLGEERPACRCSRHKIPTVTDVELDDFVQYAPERQLLIVSIVSSLFPHCTPTSSMLEQMHTERNRNRTRPCLQSRMDAFRLLLYDVATAADHTEQSHPLLLARHNVIPGMFLIYEGGKLVFCDHIFNGYGNARKDFQKQLVLTRQLANTGQSLPRDFRFSPIAGRHGARAAWGGEIGGAGVDRHGSPGVTLEERPLRKRQSSTSSSPSSASSASADLAGTYQPHIRADSCMKYVRDGLSAMAIQLLPGYPGSRREGGSDMPGADDRESRGAKAIKVVTRPSSDLNAARASRAAPTSSRRGLDTAKSTEAGSTSLHPGYPSRMNARAGLSGVQVR